LYLYRVHTGSLSQRYANRRAVGGQALRRAFERAGAGHRRFRAGILVNLAIDASEEGQPREARRMLARACRLAPVAVLCRTSKRMLWRIARGEAKGGTRP
jgi:hypothetical protein